MLSEILTKVFSIDITAYVLIVSAFLIGIIIDKILIYNKVKAQAKLGEMAFVDPLTGGKNRANLLKDIDGLISKDTKFAVCFMDLDGFKQINDTMGHDAGDQLLILLYTTIRKKLPDNCEIYRIGGDEFALTIKNFKSIEDISKILDGIKKELSAPIVIQNTEITLEYSMGIAIYPTDSQNREDLITYADDAMYYIKENGKANYHFHNKVLKSQMENKNKLQIDLKKAYEKGQFGLEFQPRIDLIEKDNLTLEALSYWNHPVLGYMKAEYFIKAAEDLGIILNIDEHVLSSACKKLQELKKKGNKNVRFAINMSKVHTKRRDFIERIAKILEEYKLDKDDIILEFTDPIKVSEIDNYKNFIDRVKPLGVSITTANLEVEYSALKLIKHLDIDELKIKAKYLDLESNLKERVFTDIVTLGKDLDYKVIVTHVEDKRQYEKCVEHKVNKVQGNYVCKRIREEQLDDYIQNHKKHTDNLI